jgi:hypothetical protein
MKVITSPYVDDKPRFELSARFRALMPPEWNADFDRWSRDFFGVEPMIYKMVDPDGDVLICSPRAYDMIQRQAAYLKQFTL